MRKLEKWLLADSRHKATIEAYHSGGIWVTVTDHTGYFGDAVRPTIEEAVNVALQTYVKQRHGRSVSRR